MSTVNQPALITNARKELHKRLLEEGVLNISKDGVASNADKSSPLSVRLAESIAKQLTSEVGDKLAGQTSGNKFEELVADFTRQTFCKLQHIRPGEFRVVKVSSRKGVPIADYEQYSHLLALKNAAEENPALAIALGKEYTIAPDVIVYREPLEDAEINSSEEIVDESSALRTSLRKTNGGAPILLASISSKWTMRSDRAQNSRSEALNLIRNRKGHLPHIVVVTAEPLPSRLSSLALGTGDIDCVYHFALNELMQAVEESGNEEAQSLMKIMVEGKRLKDISDLPLDLAV